MELNLFGTTLYGRETEVAQLQNLLEQTIRPGAQAQFAFVHGLSGTGKTALCQTLRQNHQTRTNKQTQTTQPALQEQPLQQKGKEEQQPPIILFCSGKFDQLTQPSNNNSSSTNNTIASTHAAPPFSAIVQALEDLCAELEASPSIDNNLADCLNYEAAILKLVVPTFAKLSKAQPETRGDNENRNQRDNNDDNETSLNNDNLVRTSERLAVGLRTFLREFCRPHRPLVMFIDDLQFSDAASLKVLSAVVNDKELENCLLIGGARDEEDLGKDQLQSLFLDPIRAQDNSRVHDIALQNLDLTSTNEWLMEILSMRRSPAITMELAQLVHKRTHGNPFFVLQYIQVVSQMPHCLTYNFARGQWEWNVERIMEETNVTENVVDVVKLRIRRLPAETTRLLQLAASLGYYFDLALLQFLRVQQLADCLEEGHSQKGQECTTHLDVPPTTERELSELLQQAVKEGFVEISSSWGRFTHDKVQLSFYKLFPQGSDTQTRLHWRIGKLIQLYRRSHVDNPKYLLLAVDQLNMGSRLFVEQDEEERLALIKLNLQAAKAAISLGGSQRVADCLDKGIQLSRTSDWRSSYELMLELHSLLAEVEFSRGVVKKSEACANKVLQLSKNVDDTVRVAIVLMDIHGTQLNGAVAIKEARKLLKALGVRLPPSSFAHFRMELVRTRQAVKGKEDSFFLALKDATSSKHKTIMKILLKTATFGWVVNPTLTWICYCLMIRMTVSHGFFGLETPSAFGGYAYSLAQAGEIKGAVRFSELAMKRANKRALPSVVMLQGAGIGHLGKPSALWLEPLLKGYRTGIETGDLVHGSLCLSNYVGVYVVSGFPLDHLNRDCAKFGEQLKLTHQEYGLVFLVIFQHFSACLMGKLKDPLDFSVESIRQQTDLWTTENFFQDKEDLSCFILDYCWLLAAFFLRNDDVMERVYLRVLSRRKRRHPGYHFSNLGFYILADGLVGFHLWRRKHKVLYRRTALKAMKEIRGHVKKHIYNTDGIYTLLRAEWRSLRVKDDEDISDARRLYEDAIVKFSKEGRVHLAANANESAGEFMLRCGDDFWGKIYLNNAAVLYREHKAEAKVTQLQSSYDFIDFSSNPVSPATAIHGRSRFDSVRDTVEGQRKISLELHENNEQIIMSDMVSVNTRPKRAQRSSEKPLSAFSLLIFPLLYRIFFGQ